MPLVCSSGMPVSRAKLAPARYLSAVLACLFSLPWPAAAERAGVALRENQWDFQATGAAQHQWAGESVVLSAREGSAATGVLRCKEPQGGDFDAQVSFELQDWKGGQGKPCAMSFGVELAGETVIIGREWSKRIDRFRTGKLRGGGLLYPFELFDAEPTGRMRIVRRPGWVETYFRLPPDSWQTMELVNLDPGPVKLVLGVGNTGGNVVSHPPVRVRFFDLTVQDLPPLRGGEQAAQPQPANQTDWVIYATSVGWLRIGLRAQFAAERKMKQEIWGGESDDPLQKKLLKGGFASGKDALKYLCERLTKVVVDYNPTRPPYEVVKGLFQEKEYYLHLAGAEATDDLLPASFEYDFNEEKQVLARYGLTPRATFGRQWLIYALEHSTRQGPKKVESWMLYSGEPRLNKKDPSKGIFVMPDGLGGTFTYSCKTDWEGPYRDNYGLARAMKRLGIDSLEVYPPGRRYRRTVVAGEIPAKPRDYGTRVLGVQPLVDPYDLRQWVIYVTNDKWLHVGTLKEFETKVLTRDLVWGGTSDAPVKNQQILLQRTVYAAREQAMEALLKALKDVTVGYHPRADPRNTLQAKLAGREVTCQLARSNTQLVANYRSYNYRAELELMLDHDVIPVTRFGKQWLAHATGHGTYSGPVKDDRWMMVAGEPKNGRAVIPDGGGGTFTYSVDKVQGPFEDSLALAKALKSIGLTSIRLAGGGGRYLSVDDHEAPPKRPQPQQGPARILSIEPTHGEPGTQFYVTVVAVGMEPWYKFTFGDGVTVTDETYLGANPDGPGDRWLATITLGENTSWRPR